MERDPLLTTITDRLLDRLEDCVAKFPTAVILGGAGELKTGRAGGGGGGVEQARKEKKERKTARLLKRVSHVSRKKSFWATVLEPSVPTQFCWVFNM